jgi:thymidylate synthase
MGPKEFKMSIDFQYAVIAKQILETGIKKEGRNGNTISIFGAHMSYDVGRGFPLLRMRKIFYKGILGEFKSFLDDAKSVQEFEANGCNYWKLWADEDGALRLDYPPREQLDYVINLLKTEPNSRRMIIDLWNPDNRGKLSLDPCHTQYQFYVRNNKLDMIWNQRSVDWAIGAPSDFVLAALYNITIANEVGLQPGIVTFNFGDTHVYEEHIEQLTKLVKDLDKNAPPVLYKLDSTTKNFTPEDLAIYGYNTSEVVKFYLKA